MVATLNTWLLPEGGQAAQPLKVSFVEAVAVAATYQILLHLQQVHFQ